MKKQRPLIVTILLFLLASNIVFAAYLRNVPVKITQPDGQVVDCFASGDEYYNWLHDAGNHTIIKDPENGVYVFAIIEDGKLAPSEFVVGKDDPQASGIEPGLNVFPEKTLLKSARIELKSSNSTTGYLNNIVIFIRLADQEEFNTPFSDYQNIFNGDDFSLLDYFSEISGDQLNIFSTFYPRPNNDLILSYRDSYDRNYYQAYNATSNPYGYSGDDELTEREHTLLQNAVKFVKPAIEASGLEFDADQDGDVDNICFIIQGNVEGWSGLLWPHRWALYSKQVFINDLRVWDYNFQLSERTNVSVLCHEMFHTIGAPDLYHYESNGSNPVGGWDLMASDNAQHTMTWLKHKYGNWFQNIPELNASGTYKLAAVSVNPFACYKIPVPESFNEFFMVEFRKKSGYDKNLSWHYDEGLLVYRVNSQHDGNSTGPPDEVYVLRPGIPENPPGGYLNKAAFSDINNRNELTPLSDPYPFLENGAMNSFRIYDVKIMGDSIEFKFHKDEPVISLNLHLNLGWNIFSVPNYIEPADIKNLFQPLIDNSTLVKIQDEAGNSVEDYGFLGWSNYIGDINPGKGYKLKVSGKDSIKIWGTLVDYPYPVPLKTGWNLIGFPHTSAVNALDVIQSFINNGNLEKVQDELGNAIEYMGFIGGWKNFIGDFTPGKGYRIKLTADDILWIQEAYPKSIAMVSQRDVSEPFSADYQGSVLDHINISCCANSFSKDGTIEVNLAHEAEVQMEVLNQLGQRVNMVSNKILLENGNHRFFWNGRNSANQQVSSGIYTVRVILLNGIYFNKVIYNSMR